MAAANRASQCGGRSASRKQTRTSSRYRWAQKTDHHEETEPAIQNLPGLSAPVQLAQEVGTKLGRNRLLLRAVSARETGPLAIIHENLERRVYTIFLTDEDDPNDLGCDGCQRIDGDQNQCEQSSAPSAPTL